MLTAPHGRPSPPAATFVLLLVPTLLSSAAQVVKLAAAHPRLPTPTTSQAQRESGDLASAAAGYRWVLTQFSGRDGYGPNHRRTLTAAHGLGATLMLLGEESLHEARKLLDGTARTQALRLGEVRSGGLTLTLTLNPDPDPYPNPNLDPRDTAILSRPDSVSGGCPGGSARR